MLSIDECRASLVSRGYVEVSEIEGLRAGIRVRSLSERFGRAYREGTGTVRHVLRKDPSAWAVNYQRPDIEVIVDRDDRDDSERGPAVYADYHIEVVGDAGGSLR